MKYKIFAGGYRFNKMFFKSFFKVFLLCITAMAVVVGLYYKNVSKYYMNEIDVGISNELKRSTDVAEIILREIEYMISGCLNDESIRMFMYGNERTYSTNEVDNRIVLSNNAHRMYVHSIYVYSEVSGLIHRRDETVPIEKFSDKTWFEAYNTENGNFIQINRKIANKYPCVMTFIKKVNGVGGVIVNIDIVKLVDILGITGNDGMCFYIVDKNNRIVYCDDMEKFSLDAERELLSVKQGASTVKIGNKKCFGKSFSSSKYDIDYIVLDNYENYTRKIFHIRVIVILIIVLFTVLIAIIAYSAASSTTTQVYSLIEFVNHLDKSKLNEMCDEEVRYIAEKIIGIVDEFDELKKEMNSKIKEYTKYQSMILQSQINPHFLNNTISNINYCVIEKLGVDDDISQSLIKMTRMIQYCFTRDNFFVTLEEEMNFVNMYIEIMKRRYGEFEYTVKVQEDMKKKKILRLMLQPMIENAICHGIIKNINNAKICLAVTEHNDILRIEVSDNGCGMSDEKIKMIIDSFQSETFELKHIGLKSIYRRLKTIYGTEANLVVESTPGERTAIIITINESGI